MKSALLLLCLLFPLTSHAEGRVDAALVASSGKPIKDWTEVGPDDRTCEKCPPLTLGLAMRHALLAEYPDEAKEMTGDKKFARWGLAERIRQNPDAALSSEETALVKRLIGKLYNTEVVGAAYSLLDPNAKPGDAR